MQTSDTDQLHRVKRTAEALRAALPQELCADASNPNAGILFKVALFRELLMHRLCDFVDSTLPLCEGDRLIPALVLTRAAAETTVMLCWLHQKLAQFIKTKDKVTLERFLVKGTFGNSRSTVLDQVCDVLMVVDRLDKEAQGFKQMYNVVCEFTDTNYAAALGTFGQIDKNRNTLNLGKRQLNLSNHWAGSLLMVCLKLAREYYGKISEILAGFEGVADQAYDRGWKNKVDRNF